MSAAGGIRELGGRQGLWDGCGVVEGLVMSTGELGRMRGADGVYKGLEGASGVCRGVLGE